MEIVNEFPTIVESLCRDETVSDKKYGNTTPKIPMEINESDITNNANSQNGNNNKPVDNKLDNDGFKMKTYATKVDNKLKLIPTGINNGREVVMFDDEILQEGIKKWQLTLCGHFVGYRMSYAELRDEEGMDHVLESGPWMVNNKPLFIQRWNTNVIMDKKEPKTLPLWVKLYSVPIEAWTVNGISVIASSLGKPLIMDKTTTRMCNEGGLSKFVEVEYSWKPPVCSICKVFGHQDNKCGKAQREDNDSNGGKAQGNNGKGNLESTFGGKRHNNFNGQRGQRRDGNGWKMGEQINRNVRGIRKNKKQTWVEYRPVQRETSKENTSTSDGMLNR
ncbi:RNA-directed DNA polymerase, eukaryota, reverse transcriptase zinc-binding domain protein [Tanacetum coccineum]|uniref:RNA-directed DNA polymerase, eukaryota, reverse transcriptase zinc-binding domain protein n=1 Tax=Tanacetum coccineum TaxID=301880 RepID=A0ABQ5GIP5_9ASTR